MTAHTVMDLGAATIFTAMKIAAPALIAAVGTGLLVSIFQAATQINEQTLSFIPKIIVMTVALIICGPWILSTMVTFTTTLLQEIPNYIR